MAGTTNYAEISSSQSLVASASNDGQVAKVSPAASLPLEQLQNDALVSAVASSAALTSSFANDAFVAEVRTGAALVVTAAFYGIGVSTAPYLSSPII